MDAVIYVRWSSAEQSRGSSRDRQLDVCKRHAAAKGWRVVKTIIDDGISGFTGKNVSSTGRLGQFVADVEAGAYSKGVALVTEKLDRLSREEPVRVFVWMVNLTGLGVVVSLADRDRDFRNGQFDMASIFEVVVGAQLSHDESKKKSDRLAAAWARKRRQLSEGEAVVLTRRTPAWITVAGSPPRFELIEERAQVVRRIFEETVAGYGKHSIARRLNQEGVATFGRASGWHPSYIQKILNSTTVLGEMQPGRKARGSPRELAGDPIAGYYPAVIDADLHARARASMAGRSRRVAGRGRRLVNIFSGLAVCGSCGARMTFRGKGERVRADGERVSEDYLVCDSYQRGRGCSSGQHYNYLAWESAVLNAVLAQAMGDEHFASQHEVRALEVEHAELTRSRDAARRKADAAMTLFMETTRPEAKAAFEGMSLEADRLDEAIVAMRKRITAARGVVTPAEHQRRIFDLFDQMSSDDEDVRFEARSRVMEAVHGLIGSMRFGTAPDVVEVTTKSGLGVSIECTGGRGPDAEFFYRYDPGFFG
jgi:DNA invertase Pin-like site-specific DNA recombinase